MAREYATQDRILESIVSRLQDRIEEWPGSECFVSDDPQPLQVPPSDTFCVVSPGDGDFPPEFWRGGGYGTCTESARVLVTPYVLHAMDSADQLSIALLQPEKGILTSYKQRILKALLKSWEPTYNGNELLRSLMRPASCTRPGIMSAPGGAKYVTLTLAFETEFDWEL